jgi:hypothetical protein
VFRAMRQSLPPESYLHCHGDGGEVHLRVHNERL